MKRGPRQVPRPSVNWCFSWWRGVDLNHRPPGYEPDELPDCSTPRRSTTRYRARPGDAQSGIGSVRIWRRTSHRNTDDPPPQREHDHEWSGVTAVELAGACPVRALLGTERDAY